MPDSGKYLRGESPFFFSAYAATAIKTFAGMRKGDGGIEKLIDEPVELCGDPRDLFAPDIMFALDLQEKAFGL